MPFVGLGRVLFAAPCDPAAGKIIGAHLNRDLITGENPDKIHPELSGNMRQYCVSIANINLEHGIGQ